MFNQGDGLEKPLSGFRSLHRANLKDSASLLDDLFNELAFGDGQRERLFTVNVFPAYIASTAILVCQ